ncbi:1-phosphatidylinositol 3-phosphate 5-kinase-like [Elysia marginata]|uniref:1-phosphatidylinositol 3-phosphate 5-kinase-like n=1 Tax=Elysia marginata TaxID=1093978 RepID=A0AAV4F3M2_9GAST|nr:1-phosphatidylinositol 3-phosphate 5-kinase-like [Elysia marginata]
MAHVLLAFHTYSLKELKTHGDVLGLDFSAYKNPLEKFLKYASDIFGPVGDYRGVRDVWLEDCRQRNVKSIVSNYKDNRFNGLFHVSGQIFYHHFDFIRILQNHKNSNFRQTTVLNGLKNKNFILLLKCLGLYYYKITGPYWHAITSGKYSYPQVRPVVKNLHQTLKTWKEEPASIFSPSKLCLPQLPTPSVDFETPPNKEDEQMFYSFVSIIAQGFLNALEAQVPDFLADNADAEHVSTCEYAPATNLVCERGLGMLDASQRKRPNASLHHHSTVVALKQTRTGGLYPWLQHLSAPVRDLLWKKARKGGQELRKKHMARDLATQRECHRLSQIQPSASRDGKSTRCMKIPHLDLPNEDDVLQKDAWIAVAYPQRWYTGGIRVCTYCCQVVQRYAQQSTTTGDFRALEDLRAISQSCNESGNFEFVQNPLSPRLSLGIEELSTPVRGEQLPEIPTVPELSTPFDLTPQSDFSSQESLLLESKLLIQDSVQLRELWRQICDIENGVETQTLRIRLRTYTNCIVGRELVDWLIKADKAATR